jgi:hypothetical protein
MGENGEKMSKVVTSDFLPSKKVKSKQKLFFVLIHSRSSLGVEATIFGHYFKKIHHLRD